ncbi:MAG TPA: type II toxin-antitoxin system PemK/MazF family toxin [Bacillota bacterium]|nr:type II toxin-antitoxin system PemK/MazF family toxin [Bacillota bacterium]
MIKRGEIYLIDWSPGRGSEQAGLRPALVLQNDIGNKYSPTTIVAAVTTSSGKTYPFQVRIEPEECGLSRPSKVLLEQILTVSKERLVKKIGQISPQKLYEVEKAIHNSLGLLW